jgi:hypothetical protein
MDIKIQQFGFLSTVEPATGAQEGGGGGSELLVQIQFSYLLVD